MSTNRRKAIEYLCRCFMTRENENVEFLRRDYEHLVRPVISKLDLVGMINLEEVVVNVGSEIFETRPAKMAYVCAFMEFVCEITRNNENISLDDVIRISANVVENTDFKIPSPTLLRRLLRNGMVVFNIFVDVLKY